MFQLATGLADKMAKALDDQMWDLRKWDSFWDTLPASVSFATTAKVCELIVLLFVNRGVSFHRRIHIQATSLVA